MLYQPFIVKNSPMTKYVQMGVDAVTRPPRDEYDPSSLPNSVTIPGYGEINRIVVGFKNPRGFNIVGSYFAAREEIAERSCVIYLHGNASSQHEGMFLVPYFIPAGVSVLCFDFSGCGRSGGERISLGFNEKDDVLAAIDYVRATHNIARVALWGRSMGAACTIFTLAEDPTIAGAVCDSAFASLNDLVKELATKFKVPSPVVSVAASMITKKIKTLCGFDVSQVEPIKFTGMCFSPIFFIHGENDTFINCEHTRRLFITYTGEDKQMFFVPGDHNSERPVAVQVDAIMFLARVLDAPVITDDLRQLMGSGHHHFHGVEEMVAAMGDGDYNEAEWQNLV